MSPRETASDERGAAIAPAGAAWPVLCVEALRFGYGGAMVFDGFDARFAPGLTLLVGEDGSGRTTLLRLLAGDLAALAGRVRLLEGPEDSAGVDPTRAPEAWRARVLLAGDDPPGLEQVTPMAYFASMASAWPAFDQARLDTLIDGLALGPHAGKHMFMLSMGTRRKVWIAAAIASGAPVTLIDDPHAALDQTSIRVVDAALAEAACDTGRIWVVAHHDRIAAVGDCAVIALAGAS